MKHNPVPKISLLILASAYLYLYLISGQPRMADGGLSDDEMYFVEKVFSLVTALSVFATMGVGLLRAYKASRWRWFWLQFFVFPFAYVYTLFVNRGDALDKGRPPLGST